MKTVVLILTLIASTGSAARAASKVTDYKGFLLDDKVFVTNGKYTYVVDPANLKVTIAKRQKILIKIYSTNIWFTISNAGEVRVKKTQIKNWPYFVLAPLKNLRENEDASVDYKKYAMGYVTTASLEYPLRFCSSCAAPTQMDKAIETELKKIVTTARQSEDDETTVQRFPSSI
jgi:hypothetical protein